MNKNTYTSSSNAQTEQNTKAATWYVVHTYPWTWHSFAQAVAPLKERGASARTKPERKTRKKKNAKYPKTPRSRGGCNQSIVSTNLPMYSSMYLIYLSCPCRWGHSSPQFSSRKTRTFPPTFRGRYTSYLSFTALVYLLIIYQGIYLSYRSVTSSFAGGPALRRSFRRSRLLTKMYICMSLIYLSIHLSIYFVSCLVSI